MMIRTLTNNGLLHHSRLIPVEMDSLFPSVVTQMLLDAKNQFEQRVEQVVASGKVDDSFFGDLLSLFEINNMFRRESANGNLSQQNVNTDWMSKYNEIYQKAGFFSHVILENKNPLEFRQDLVQFFEKYLYIRNGSQLVLEHDGIEIICELGKNSKLRPFDKVACEKDTTISQLNNYMERFKDQFNVNTEGYPGVMLIDGVAVAHPKLQIKMGPFYSFTFSMGFTSNVNLIEIIVREKFKRLLNLSNV